MSISTTLTKHSYEGNSDIGSAYPIEFKYLEDSHVKVYFDGVLQQQGNGADYTMGGVGTENTGFIKTNVPQPATVEVTIVLDVPFDQPVDLQETGLLSAEELEGAYDRLNMQIRRVWRKLGDVLTFNTDEAGASTGTADNLIGFDGSGDIAEIPNSTFLQTANDLSDVDAATARTNLGLGTAATTAATDYVLNSEVDQDIKTLNLPANTVIGTFGADLVSSATRGTANSKLNMQVSELGDTTITNPVSGETLEWNGSAWVNSLSNTQVDTSDTAPVSPNDGDLWYDSTSGLMYVYYNDGSSSQWVTITSAVSSLDASSVAYTPAGTGAVVTDLQTKNRESVSVKDFGAVGDGVTDDTVAIQNAINANPNKRIYLPSGNYVVSTIEINSCKLFGDGDSTVITQTGSELYIIKSSGSKGSSSNLSADADTGTNTCTVVDGSVFSDGDWVLITDSDAYSTASTTYRGGELIEIDSVAGNVITFVTDIVGSMSDTKYTTANSAKVTQIFLEDNPSVSNLKMVGDVATTTALVMFSGCRNAVASNLSCFTSGNYGVRFNNCADSKITNCQFSGFLDDTGAGHVGYCVLASGGTSGLLVDGNSFRHCRHGFTTIGGADGFPSNMVISNNTANNTLNAAFDTHSAGKHIVISNNTVVNSDGSGISCRSQYTTITGNRIYNPRVHGIALAEENCKSVYIEGNHIEQAGSIGVSAGYEAEDIFITGNILNQIGDHGIVYGTGTNRCIIKDNYLRDVGVGSVNRSAIVVTSTASSYDGTVIENNMITCSSAYVDYGVRDASTDCIVINNLFRGSYGVDVVSVTGSSTKYNNQGDSIRGRFTDTGLSLAATGNVSRSVAHGFGETFDKDKVSLTIIGTNTNSFALNWIRLTSIDATNINYAINVATADAGGTLDMGIVVSE